MKLYIGTKFYGHDSHICAIVPDKKLVFSLSLDRVTRYKHDPLYPVELLEKIYSYLNLKEDNISEVVICCAETSYLTRKNFPFWHEYETSLREFYDAKYKKEFSVKHQGFKALPYSKQQILLKDSALKEIQEKQKSNEKILLAQEIEQICHNIFPKEKTKIKYFDHHDSHAFGSYFLSDYNEAIAITFDGAGDGYFSKIYRCKNGKISCITGSKRVDFEVDGIKLGNSLGNVYEYFTLQLGYQRFSEEGKVEALAAFGKPNKKIYKRLEKCYIFDKKKLSIDIDQKLFKKYFSQLLFDEYLIKFSKASIAAAVQKFLEDKVVEYVLCIKEKFKINNFALSGGVFANVLVNQRLYQEVSQNIYIIPAMTDEGLGFGSALLGIKQDNKLDSCKSFINTKTCRYSGTNYTKEDVLKIISTYQEITYKDISKNWEQTTAKYIFKNQIGAIFHGRMEWGPRALGNRSIIGNPLNKNTVQRVNLNIKKRPFFQPFCPSILLEEKNRLFKNAYKNKDMTCAFTMKQKHAKKLPCAVHIDNTARVQFVSKQDNHSYYKILKEFKKLSGYGVLLNTSFNKHGRTIVESIDDALRDFLDTDLDFLIIEGIEVRKKS